LQSVLQILAIKFTLIKSKKTYSFVEQAEWLANIYSIDP